MAEGMALNHGMIVGEPLVVMSPRDIKKDLSALFWSDEPDRRLLHSLATTGQLSPILLAPKDGSYQLLSGYRRLRALEQLEKEVIARIMVMPDAYHQGLMYLDENSDRAKSPGQMVQALRYFQTHCRNQNWFEPVIHRFNLSGTSRVTQHLQSWLNVSLDWDSLLVLGTIPLEAGPLLTQFGPEGCSAVRPFFDELAWSRGNALHFLTWIWERSRMDGVSVESTIADCSLSSILHSDLSPKDRIQRLTARMKEFRYPELSSAQFRMQEACRKWVKGTSWRAEHPDEFETQDILLTTKVHSEADVKVAAADLQRLSDSKVIFDVWAAFPEQGFGEKVGKV